MHVAANSSYIHKRTVSAQFSGSLMKQIGFFIVFEAWEVFVC